MNDRYGQPTGFGGGSNVSPAGMGQAPNGWSNGPGGYGSNPYGDAPFSARNQKGLGPDPGYGNGSAGVGTGGMPQNGRRPSENQGIPSPPQSISRSSDGATLYTGSEGGSTRKGVVTEEALLQHYQTLRAFLEPTLSDEKNGKGPTKARDKLLRLSMIQFQELSTDVFDELNRRQAQDGRNGETPGRAPPYLLPKETFHPKRNQARQKLSTLPAPRFKDLAADVYYELERRFPKFSAEIRPPSPVPSMPGARPLSGGSMSSFVPPNGMDRSMNMSNGPGQGQMPGPGPQQGQGLPANGPRGGAPFAHRQPGGSIASLGGPGPAMPNQNMPPPRFDSPVSVMNNSPRPYDTASEASSNDYNRPQAKTLQSNTIVPNISTMVEDDDDQSGVEDADEHRGGSFESGRLGHGFGLPGNMQRNNVDNTAEMQKMRADFEKQIQDLKSALLDAESTHSAKNEQISQLRDGDRDSQARAEKERNEWRQTRATLEDKIADAAEEAENLRGELDRVKGERANMEREMRQQIEMARGHAEGSSALKDQLNMLATENENLKSELQEQQHVTEEVRQQAAAFLKEMQALSAGSGQHWDREDDVSTELQRHKEEAQLWKTRYTRTKTQLRDLRASSHGLSLPTASSQQLHKDNAFTHPEGLVKDLHVTKFQIAIDELLRAARTAEPSIVLEHMKTVVMAVRNITQSVPDLPANDGPLAHERLKIKARVSATANNLITASKNFASSNGMSPVSLLDAAASHLTAAVIDLLKTVKIRPTPPGELEDDVDQETMSRGSPSLFSVPNGRTSDDSTYSLGSRANEKQSWLSRVSPARLLGVGKAAQPQTNGTNGHHDDRDLEELKTQLDDQMQGLYTTIQALVSSIRIGDGMPILRNNIDEIADLVRKVIMTTDRALRTPERQNLLQNADNVLQNLSECRAKLLNAANEGERITNEEDFREFTNELPSLAFEIVRETKELVRRLDEATTSGRRTSDDDFR